MLDKELRSMIGDVKDGRMDRRAFIMRMAAVGLTAAVAAARGDAGISCNVVAAAYHDHLFVPVESAAAAVAALRALQERAQQAR